MNSDPLSSQPGALDPHFSWRLPILAVIFAGLIAIFWFAHHGTPPGVELPYNQMSELLKEGRIVNDRQHPLELQIDEGSSVQTLAGYHSANPLVQGHPENIQPFHTTISPDYDKDLKSQLKSAGLTPNILNKSNMLATTLLGFLPILTFLLMLCLMVGAVYLVISLVNRPPHLAPPQ